MHFTSFASASLLLTLCSLFSSCDSGDITETEHTTLSSGRTVRLTATVAGIHACPEKYSVALAGFDDNSNYAIVQRALSSDIPDNTEVELVLSNLSEQVTMVEFAVTNRLRERILTLERLRIEDMPDAPDTIDIQLGTVDLSMFGLIQSHVFNAACIQCHGGNGGGGAAGLNLTSGKAFSQLVDVPSTRVEGQWRVLSGDAEGSLLHQILSEGGEDILHYNHTEVLSSQFKENVTEVRQFIDEWIKGLK